MSEFEASIKCIVVGNGKVGKTSLINRFVTGEYNDSYKKTLGAAFCEKEQYVDSIDKTIKFMIWDTAGQEEFDAVTKRYYRGAGACVFAFSTTDRSSFLAVEKWYQKVKQEVDQLAMVLIENKVDLSTQSVIDPQESEELANRLGLKFFKCSVKENLNVKQIFDYLAENYMKIFGSQIKTSTANTANNNNTTSENQITQEIIQLAPAKNEAELERQKKKKKPVCDLV